MCSPSREACALRRRRRDPVFRQFVADTGRLLAPHGFALMQRGRVGAAVFIGLRRPVEAMTLSSWYSASRRTGPVRRPPLQLLGGG